MKVPDPIQLTQELIRYQTINPPGNEKEIAEYLGKILADFGFDVRYPELGKNRLNIIAEKGLSASRPPIVFTGHTDVVPLGGSPWTVDPFFAEIKDGKLYGRGSSDMKSGVAAMVCAAIMAFENGEPEGGVRLLITAGEEIGCQGARELCENGYNIGKARGLVIGEPTSNKPFIGHKGGLFMNAYCTGITVHSSMPHLGDNAIYKAARAISAIESLKFDVEEDSLLGYPTINVGVVKGGLNFNSVPDRAEFTIDIRSTPKLSNEGLMQQLKKAIGEEINLETFVNLGAVATEATDPFIQMVNKEFTKLSGDEAPARAIAYLTDASVLQPWYDNVSTVILGPGEAEMAHQTDEYCYVDKINECVKLYYNIIFDGKQNI
jgi:succinyl-diaminopimelate desuccinylase